MLFVSAEARHDSVAQVAAVLDSTRDDLLDYLYREDAEIDRLTVSKSTTRLTDAELAEVNATVARMIAGFAASREGADWSGLPRTSILFVLNPLGHDPA